MYYLFYGPKVKMSMCVAGTKVVLCSHAPRKQYQVLVLNVDIPPWFRRCSNNLPLVLSVNS